MNQENFIATTKMKAKQSIESLKLIYHLFNQNFSSK